ncbi:Glutathione S-transferase A [Acipenser ruthenus]|uniref:Glutathione S-transferase A n=1 Tax=Acipenser ruthenus TaxID=7906 RepID=A0A662YS98_ACIRT|nr:Glutathione S-transferase A [Acipenser ruthenus]
MASSMILYWGSGSPPCWRVMIALEEKNLQGYQQKLLSFEKNEHKSEPVMAINPRGQVRASFHTESVVSNRQRLAYFDAVKLLSHQRRSVKEASSGDTVVVYLRRDFGLNEHWSYTVLLLSLLDRSLRVVTQNQFKSQGTQLIPDSSAEQALVYQRMFETLTLQQKMADVIYYTWRVPEDERHDSAVKRNKEALSAELQLWEGYFQKMDAGSYAAGRNFTMADVMVFPQIAYAFRFGLSPEKFIKLGEYHNLVKKRPSVEASWPPHWKENPQGMDILKDF